MANRKGSLKEIALLFLRLGVVAFGGPAAHIAMMEEEVVGKRQWMSRQHFLDLVGATNLIPGPNSTEMAIHCGFHRAGWPGLILAGASFILPAALLTGALAWFYAQYRTVPQFDALTYGIKPAVLAVILSAVYKLGQKALKSWHLGVIGTAVVAMSLAGVNEIAAIFTGGVAGMVWLYLIRRREAPLTAVIPLVPLKAIMAKLNVVSMGVVIGVATAVADLSLLNLFLVFLKVGAVLFGSGYVLIAYLEGELVNRLGWLSQEVLLDAIAIGQFTPGPVLSTSTFVGYQIQGVWGAVVATLGIFLPSFLFVALLNPIVPRLRQWPVTAAFLDAVNVSALGLMLAVVIELGAGVLVDWKSWLIALLSLLVAFGFRQVNSAWIILGGAAIGYLLLQIEAIF